MSLRPVPLKMVASKDATSSQVVEIDGFAQIHSILIRLDATNDAGSTVDLDDLTFHLSHINGRNFGTLFNTSSFKWFQTVMDAAPGSTNVTNTDGGAVDMLFEIKFSALGDPQVFNLKSNEKLYMELPAISDIASGTWTIKVREEYGVIRYLPKLEDRTITLTSGTDRIELPDNVAAFMLTPATTTNPTEIEVFQGNTRLMVGSMSEFIDISLRYFEFESTPTNWLFSFTKGKNIVDGLQDNLVLEMDGGSGTMDLTLLTIHPRTDVYRSSLVDLERVVSDARARMSRVRVPSEIQQTLLPVQPRPTVAPINPRPTVAPVRRRGRARIGR